MYYVDIEYPDDCEIEEEISSHTYHVKIKRNGE